MTLQLPAGPDLHWLKNRAREKLAELRATDPAAKLARAQYAIAKAYGFASWRSLKAHIDALNDDAAALVQAVRAGEVNTIRHLLDRHPALIDIATDPAERLRPTDANTMRLLHVAVAENQIDAAKLLIQRGANVNLRNKDGRLPLHDCFELGRGEIEELLLGTGASLDVVAAAVLGRHDELHRLLKTDPALANDRTTNMTPLAWCAYACRDSSARLLLEYGALFRGTPYAFDVLHPTASVASVPVLKVLLEFGADPNWQHDNGDTMLHWVIRSRMVEDPTEFAQTLLEAGANSKLKNNAGLTPLNEATAARDKDFEQYFPKRSLGRKRLEPVIALLQRPGIPPAHTRPDRPEPQ
jgi:ankyrin repeat protein